MIPVASTLLVRGATHRDMTEANGVTRRKCPVPQWTALLPLLLLCASPVWAAEANAATERSASTKASSTLDVFWKAFREAVKSSDKSKILHLVQLPFVVRWGDADPNDPRVDYDREKFVQMLDRLLSLRVGDPGTQLTMRDIVERTPKIEPTSPGMAELEDFEFRLIKGAWRWTTVLSAEPSLYPDSQVSDVPRVSPLRKYLLDLVSNQAGLKRPLTVKHIKTTGQIAYLEVEEPEPGRRYARAIVERQADDSSGQMVWAVKQLSFRSSSGSDDPWSNQVSQLVKSGVPQTLFPPSPKAKGQPTP